METPVSLIPALMPCEKDCDVTKSEDFSCCDDNHCENTEITIVTGVDESENLSVEDYTRRYSLKQLREMCTKQNLSNPFRQQNYRTRESHSHEGGNLDS